MPIDTMTPRSPGWWLRRLALRLDARSQRFDELERYYDGTALLPAVASKATRQAYQRLMSLAHTNYAELVVEAVRERMTPVGFRTGAGGDDLGDSEAWRIWQANSLDADSDLVTRASLVMSESSVIVGGVDREIGAPVITPEDPRQVITECDPIRRRRTVAALKVFHDDTAGVDRAFVYLPGFVFRAHRPHQQDGIAASENWEWSGEPDALGFPVVPVVSFFNKPRLMGAPLGEFETHISLLDRISYTTLNMLEIATLQAFRQRAVKGIPSVDEHGEQVDYSDVFAADPGALWLLPDTAEMWESGQVDLGPLRQANQDNVTALAAVTRTPLFYLTPDATNGSAEGASLAREGLVFKTADRIKQASESWEQVMSLAFLFAGDATRARRADMEILWAPPERFSLAERFDAASKAGPAGVPWRTIMGEVLQFSPQQVDRMEAERVADVLVSMPAEDGSQPADLGASAAEQGKTLRDRVEAATALIRAGFDPAESLVAAGIPAIEHTGLVPITVKDPDEDAGQ